MVCNAENFTLISSASFGRYLLVARARAFNMIEPGERKLRAEETRVIVAYTVARTYLGQWPSRTGGRYSL